MATDGWAKETLFYTLKKQRAFRFCGTYSEWKNPNTGKNLLTYTIITTEAKDPIAKIHTRMPVILNREAEDEWLNIDISEPESALEKLVTMSANDIVMYPISVAVNKPSNNTPAVLQPDV